MNNWNDPLNDPDNYKYGIFYYNPNDDRILVPKLNPSMGWQLNFAQQETYIAIFCLVIVLPAITMLLTI